MKKLLLLLIVLVGCGDVNNKPIMVGRGLIVPTNEEAILGEEKSNIVKDVCSSLAVKSTNLTNSSRIFKFKTNFKQCDNSKVDEMAFLRIQDVNNQVRFIPDAENEAVNYFFEFETNTQGVLRFLCNQTTSPSINIVESLTSQLKRVYRVNAADCPKTNQETCFDIATVLQRDSSKEEFFTIKHDRLVVDSNTIAVTAANKGIVLRRVREEECVEPLKTVRLTSELEDN